MVSKLTYRYQIDNDICILLVNCCTSLETVYIFTSHNRLNSRIRPQQLC